jgi:hypothetical protein
MLGPLVPRRAVDALPDKVRVTVVTRVLLDHVQVDPAYVHDALRVATMAGHDIIELFSGHRSACVFYLLPECLDIGSRVCVIECLEVLAGLVWVMREGQGRVRPVDAEPPAFYLSHVPHQPEQGQPGRRNRPVLQLAGRKACALEQERVAMEVQPGLQRLALAQYKPGIGIDAFYRRSGP